MHPPTVMAVPELSSCTDQDVKPPTFLDTGLAWSQAAPGARRKPSGHVLKKSDRYKFIFYYYYFCTSLFILFLFYYCICDIVIYISIYIDLVRKHWRCRCRCRWLSNPHSSWFENGLHAWIISLIWNLFVWFLWNQMKQFLKYDFSANLHYFWSNFFVCLLARYVAVGFLIINFVHTCFLKPSLLLKALCIVIMAKHMGLLLQTLLDCWHCLLSIHQPVSSSSLVWKGSTRIFFPNALQAPLSGRWLVQRFTVHTNAIEWVNCGTFEKRAWSGKRTSTTIARSYATIGRARDADLSDKMKSSNLPLYM